MTYTVVVSPEAQKQCNNSPVFDEFPPLVICANEPLDFDHSASDLEGDDLVYEFCGALKGGGIDGIDGSGGATTCTGFRPDPACPPPYEYVDYAYPTYGPKTPMIGDPDIEIDPYTGRISGTPTIQGQFVVGVCVKEYRNEELLSITQRDFQFNVANCEPLVAARVEADEQPEPNVYLIRLCNQLETTVVNISKQLANISDHFWNFNIPGQPNLIESWDAPLVFPDTGTYDGLLILNPNSDCGDTAKIIIEVHNGPGRD
ncbi:MAG: hypothetical protein AAFP19_27135 [Bacteroidota bacterium]